jgi:hypothetical protein
VNKQIPPAAPASDGPRMPSAKGTETRPDALAVSPAIGPLPAIYVPPPPSQATAVGLLWRATVRAGGWAVRHLSGPAFACPAGEATAADFADPDGNTWVMQKICYRPGTHRLISTAEEADDVAHDGLPQRECDPG